MIALEMRELQTRLNSGDQVFQLVIDKLENLADRFGQVEESFKNIEVSVQETSQKTSKMDAVLSAWSDADAVIRTITWVSSVVKTIGVIAAAAYGMWLFIKS